MAVKTSALKCRPFVQKREPFHAKNLFSERTRGAYVVYSYGKHFPLFVYLDDEDIWYENRNTNSPTTERHRVLAHPEQDTVKVSTTMLDTKIREAMENFGKV